MNKQEFMGQLRQGLSGLPKEETEERLAFYSEIIDDRVEEGLSETEAVSEIGPVDAVVAQILSDIPFATLVKKRVKPNRALKAWEIILIVLGAPVWFSLLIAAFAVVFAVYLVIWSVVISLWSVAVSVAACSLGVSLSAVVFALQGNGLAGLAILSAGVCCAGLSIFLFFGCKAATKGIILLTKKMGLGIKTLFVRKEEVQ